MDHQELRSSIDTIVIVMLENRSFDHVLGHLSLPGLGCRVDVDGITDLNLPLYANPSEDGTVLFPFLAEGDLFPRQGDSLLGDLPHDPKRIAMQMACSEAAGGTFLMNGFVRAYEDYQRSIRVERPAPLAILGPSAVPAMSFLAERFLVCDRWFSCLPTSTQPNRLMAMSGFTRLSDGRRDLLPNQTTVFDWLAARDVRFRVYSSGFSFYFLMPRLVPLLLGHHRDLGRLAGDVQDERDGAFPEVIFIEPEYLNAPIHRRRPSDDHPPLPMGFGEQFLCEVYHALTSNPARWARMALIITFDEHGGFFDHVPPLRVPYAGPGFTFHTTGLRVPAIVASPFVAPTSVSHANLDHTSILQLFAERFGKVDPRTSTVEPYSMYVEARRRAGIESVSAVLDADIVCPVEPPRSPTVHADGAVDRALGESSPDQRAFVAAAKHLLQRHPAAAREKFPELLPR